MTKIPDSILSVSSLLLHIFLVPVFYLCFILFYASEWIMEFYDAGLGIVFNTLMTMCILIGVLCLSRIPMTACRHRLTLTWRDYMLWSGAEFIVFSCFAALYMALVRKHYGYFPALSQCLQIATTVLIYPYTLFALLIALVRPDEEKAAEDDLVRFIDNTGRLKLVIAHDAILYVEAKENYVSILYTEGEKIKEYSLRQSMRGIEQIMDKHGIIRCQRSYFVNPRHVKILRRDKEGMIQADLDIPNTKSVPVSPKYYEELSKML